MDNDNDTPKNLFYVAKVKEVDNWEDEGKKYLKRHKTLLIDRFDSLTDDEYEKQIDETYDKYDKEDKDDDKDDKNDKDTNKDDKGKWKQYLEILEEFRRKGKDRSESTVDSNNINNTLSSRGVELSKESENKDEILENKLKNLEEKLEKVIELLQS